MRKISDISRAMFTARGSSLAFVAEESSRHDPNGGKGAGLCELERLGTKGVL